MNRSTQIICLSLLAGWLTPLHLLPWVSWHSEAPVFFAVFLSAALLVFSAGKHKTVPIKAAPLAFSALGLVAGLQVWTGQIAYAGDAWVLVLYAGLCVTSYAIGHAAGQAGHADVTTSRLAAVAAFGGVISALVALSQVFQVDLWGAWVAPMLNERRPGANMAQPNHLGTLLVMALASVAFLAYRKLLGIGTSVLIGAVLIVALAATESRTALLSAFVLAVWTAVAAKRACVRHGVAVVTCVYAALACAAAVWPLFYAWWFGYRQGSGGGLQIRTDSSGRLEVWQQLAAAAMLRPLDGWGLKSQSEALSAVAHTYEGSQPFTYAHNLFLDLMISVGFPLGLACSLAALIWVYRRVFRVTDAHQWFCVALAIPVAVHSMLEFPHAYAYFIAPVLLVMGVLDAKASDSAVGRISAGWVRGGLVMLLMLGAWSAVEYWQVEEDFRVARFEALRIGTTPSDYERPHVVLLTQLKALLDATRQLPTGGMTEEQLASLRKVAARYPWSATQNRYALSLALNGHRDEAVRQLMLIRSMHGPEAYASIKENWRTLSQGQHVQLRSFPMP